MWVCGIAHAQSQLTDGFISNEALAMIGIAGDPRARRLADTLVGVGLFEPVEGGYKVHDYLDHNPSRADVLKKRAEDLARKRKEPAQIPSGFQLESGALAHGRAHTPAPASHPIPSKKKEHGSQNSASPTPIRLAFEHYHLRFLARYGQKPEYGDDETRGKYSGNINRLLKKHGLDAVKSRIDAYFDSKDPFLANSGHPLGLFFSGDVQTKLVASTAAHNGPVPGCVHKPFCTDPIEHSRILRGERKALP